MEEGKGERYLAPGRQYGNALLGVCNQEEEVVETDILRLLNIVLLYTILQHWS